MNYPIIKDIFFNNGCASDNMPVSKKHKELAKQLFEFEETIKKYLPAKDREKLIEQYSLLHSDLNTEIENTAFAEGFKAGLLVGFELFFNSPQE